MPHISVIGRKSWGARLAFFIMYVVLIAGGLSMIIPFLVMISNSFKSNLDSQTFDLVPAYWHDNQVLTKKYVEQQTNYDVNFYNLVAHANAAMMKDITLATPANATQIADYQAFLKTLPPTDTILVERGLQGDHRVYGTHPAVAEYRSWVLEKYRTLPAVQEAYSINAPDILSLAPPQEYWYLRWFTPQVDRRLSDYLTFKAQQPLERLVPAPIEALWAGALRTRVSTDIAAVNTTLGTRYAALDTAPLPLSYPATGSPKLRDVWETCVRSDIPIWFVRGLPVAHPAWTQFLSTRFLGQIALYRKAHSNTKVTAFAVIPFPVGDALLRDNVAMGEWNDFISDKKFSPIAGLTLDTPDARYRTMLRQQYGTVASVNAAYGTNYPDFATITLPTVSVMTATAAAHTGAIRGGFIGRNYRAVADYMVLHGRAFLNTLIYIVLALLFTLTVNPVTAYALSRFKLKATNKLLLFLLATMAFPAEIAMIPNFLLLRDLHLLNTFWALVLPGVANGFSIFLLKGMFDGLPQDLYEAAELDGANEMIIFWRVTMPLVKPFLAYLALGTFISAYSAFAFAFLLCPNPKMWTIMVYLQQMDWASQPIKFAAFVLASIPTLIVFVTCQRVIMQGIVLPTEK